jgi:adenylate cyclase
LQELPNGEVVTRYGFVHALYQNVLYESLPQSRRVQLHRRIGAGGEEIYGERVSEIAGELAMHFERGRDYERAAKYLQQAAGNAIRRFAYREAVGLARHGIDLLARLPNTSERTKQDLSLHLTLGVPLIATEGYASEAVGKVYTRARQLYELTGDTPAVSEVLWGVWTFHMLRAELGIAREIAQEFLTLSDRLSYPGLAMRGHWALEITFTHRGEFELALDHFEKALALYEPEQHREDSFLYALNPGVAMPCFAAWALWSQGKPDQALNRINQSLKLARELAEPHGLAHAHYFASVLYQLRRESNPAREHAEEVIRLSREHGLVMYEAMARIIVGWALAREQEIRDGLAALEDTSTVLVRPHFLALLAETLANAGQTTQALDAVEEGIALVQRNDEAYYLAELYRLRGELSNAEQAEASFKQSIEIAERQKALSWRLRSAISLARLCLSDGKKKEARELLSDVYDNFTEGFDTQDLRDAKHLLEQ